MKTFTKVFICVVIAIFFAKLLAIISYQGYDWEPDSYQHYNDANTVYANFPNNLAIGLNVWSKPLYTYFFGIPLLLGFKGLIVLQVINLLLASASGIVVFLVARKLGASKVLALFSLFFFHFSTTIFISSTSALTDQIFLLAIILGVYFATCKKYLLMSFFVGISVLSRIEGLFFVGIFGLWLYVLQYKELRQNFFKLLLSGALLITPFLIWNFLGYLTSGSITYLFSHGYPADSSSIYGTGSLFYYPKRFLLIEPLISVLFILGIFLNLKNKKLRDNPTLILLYVICFAYLALQMYIWLTGKAGSAGLMRYFVSILPLMLITAIVGISQLKINRFVLAAVVFVQIILCLINIYYFNPIPKDSHLKEAGIWVEENISADTYLITPRPEIIYFAERKLDAATIGDTAIRPGRKVVIALDKIWNHLTPTVLKAVESDDFKIKHEITDGDVVFYTNY